MSVVSTTPTTIQLSWTSSGPEIDSYEVMLKRSTLGQCFEKYLDTITLVVTFTSYNFIRLEEDSGYIITVKEINAAGRAVGVPVNATTKQAGKY